MVAGATAAFTWLRDSQGPDGAVADVADPLFAGHKAIAAYQRAGDVVRATRACDWAIEHLLQPDGDLGTTAERRDHAREYWLYHSSWIASGAQRLGRFDLSVPALAFIAAQQRPDGAFPSNPHDPATSLDVWVTSACGLALLDGGRIAEASAAAGFLIDALDRQPNGEEAFVFAWGVDSAAQARLDATPEERRLLRYANPGRQQYYVPGIALLLLGRLWLATREDALLAAADRYRRVCEAVLEHGRTYGQACKIGWGAAVLWQITRREEYLRLVDAIALGLIRDHQAPDGSWPRDVRDVEVDTACEFGVILADCAQAVAAGGTPTVEAREVDG